MYPLIQIFSCNFILRGKLFLYADYYFCESQAGKRTSYWNNFILMTYWLKSLKWQCCKVVQLGWVKTTDCPSRFSENGTTSLIETGCRNKFVWCGSWSLLEGYSEEGCSKGGHCELWRNSTLGFLISLFTKMTKSRLGLALTVLCFQGCSVLVACHNLSWLGIFAVLHGMTFKNWPLAY